MSWNSNKRTWLRTAATAKQRRQTLAIWEMMKDDDQGKETVETQSVAQKNTTTENSIVVKCGDAGYE